MTGFELVGKKSWSCSSYVFDVNLANRVRIESDVFNEEQKKFCVSVYLYLVYGLIVAALNMHMKCAELVSKSRWLIAAPPGSLGFSHQIG